MTLVSNNTTVGILYDIENAPFEMLNYTLGKARRFQPCRTIVISDWDARPEQKRWDKLLRRPGFTFRQISRTFLGKNSLDSALYDSAKLLYDEGVRRYFVITTDSDFVRIAQMLNSQEKSYIIGVGTKQASEDLRNAYDEFIVYPPEEKAPAKKAAKKAAKAEAKAEAGEKKHAKDHAKDHGKDHKDHKHVKENKENSKESKEEKENKLAAAVKEKESKPVKAGKDSKKAREEKESKEGKEGKESKAARAAKPRKGKAAKPAKAAAEPAKTAKPEKNAKDAKPAKTASSTKEAASKAGREKAGETAAPARPAEAAAGLLTVRLPRTLRQNLEARMHEEEVTMDELVTYLLMRGLTK